MAFKTYTDQLGDQITIAEKPLRIISLVPSQTELLFDLGLEESIVGITKFCIHPASKVKAKTKIGGTKNFNISLIKDLQPDLILGNKEENYVEGINELKQFFPVWMSDIFNLEDAKSMIADIGKITNSSAKADSMIKDVEIAFNNIRPQKPLMKTLYFIWQKPYMVAGTNTFIEDMMQRSGYQNLAPKTRYPQLSEAEIKALAPEVILLSSEPFPFTEKHVLEFKALCPDAEVKIVDGEMFSWYGSRLKMSPAYFASIY